MANQGQAVRRTDRSGTDPYLVYELTLAEALSRPEVRQAIRFVGGSVGARVPVQLGVFVGPLHPRKGVTEYVRLGRVAKIRLAE